MVKVSVLLGIQKEKKQLIFQKNTHSQCVFNYLKTIMGKTESRNTVTIVSIFGLAIAYILIIAINNIIYEDRITLKFMLYCSAYGAPFIVMAGMFNQYLVRWCNKQKWALKHEHLTSVLQLLFAIIIAIFFTIFAFFMFDPTPHEKFSSTFQETYFQISIIADTMVNCFILMLAKYIDQAEVVKRQEQHIHEIESEILRVKYQQLRAQVNPHFLFNSLNILISLINSNPQKATDFTKKLASIYRYLLSNDKQDVVMLSDELKFAQQYANILNIRYGDGIKINIPKITDVSLMSMRIVPTALQILIENAVKHNIISTSNPLVINIVIDNNKIIVTNNLAPRPIPADSTGIGLKGLIEKYKIIVSQDIEIKGDNGIFSVAIPLIKRQEIE